MSITPLQSSPPPSTPAQKSNDKLLKAVSQLWAKQLEALKKQITPPLKLGYLRDSNGNTILHLAAKDGHKTRIDPLIEMGCPVFLRNKREAGEAEQPSKRQKVIDEFDGETPIETFLKHHPKADKFYYSAKGDKTPEEFKKQIEKNLRWRKINTLFPGDGDDYPRPTEGFYPIKEPADPPRIENHGGYYRTPFRAHPGIYFTRNLTLTYESKKYGKCEIPSQHDGMNYALLERLHMQNEDKCTSSLNHALGNIGFVVSTAPHQEPHQLRFISLPINHSEYLVYAKRLEKLEHSERQLYNYLLEKDVLEELVDRLRDQYGIVEGYKFHAVLIDLHTLREMCGECEEATYRLQAGPSKADTPDLREQFLPTLEAVLRSRNYILPTEKRLIPDLLTPVRHSLRCVTRVSASFTWNFNTYRPSDPKILGAKYPKFEKQSPTREIKHLANSVILHSPPSHAIPARRRKELEKLPYFKEAMQQTLFLNTFPTRTLRLTKR